MMTSSTAKNTAACFGLGLALLLTLAACGSNGDGFLEPGSLVASGPGSGSGPSNTTPLPPVAAAGPDRTVAEGSLVTLDGSGSSDPNGDPLEYSWILETKPAGSGASLANADHVNPTITVDIPGTYVVALVVTDGTATSSIDRVTITALWVNGAPVANAGTDQSVDVGMTVTLDGGGSDPDHDPVTCSWTLYGPFNSAATLSDSTVCNPTFKADLPGTYTASLSVDDGYVESYDEVKITAELTVIANAGSDQYHTTGPGTVVALDCSNSYDTRGRPVTCSWSFKFKPAGSAAVFSDPAALQPSFTADIEGKYIVSLVANNGLANSQADTAAISVITVRPIDGLLYSVVDAAYSRQLDRLIMVSGSPSNQLHVYDPVGKQDRVIVLSAPATSVSISPDGTFAAVGHNGSISYVDLVAPALVKTLDVPGYLTDVALADNGYVYAFSDSLYAPIQCVNIDTGANTSVGTLFPSGGVKAVLHSAGTALYAAPTATVLYSPPPGVTGSIKKFDISGGTATFLYDSSGPGMTYGSCGDIWMSDDGSRLFSRCGRVFPASTGSTWDLWPNNRLENLGSVVHVSQSTTAGKVAAIPGPASFGDTTSDDSEVHMFRTADLQVENILPLQRRLAGNSYYAEHARYVFFNSAGTRMFVVIQHDAASGTTGYGIVMY